MFVLRFSTNTHFDMLLQRTHSASSSSPAAQKQQSSNYRHKSCRRQFLFFIVFATVLITSLMAIYTLVRSLKIIRANHYRHGYKEVVMDPYYADHGATHDQPPPPDHATKDDPEDSNTRRIFLSPMKSKDEPVAGAYRGYRRRHADSLVRLDHIPDLPPTEIVNTCGALSARSRCGVLHTDTEPIDSVVTVTFDATPATKVEAVVKAMMQPSSSEESAYFTFLGEQNAEFRYATNATSCAEGHVSSRAFEMDVVYTYVNDNAASYQAMKASRGLRFTASRTRDWNELLYSLRTVFHRGIGAGLVRKVHIVVADKDQVPQWLNASDRRINIVLHSQIFPADEPDALPTFNSHAIESVLHRIPGLSRFFVYFNNDMLWGRRVSFFDYFRPISAERQRHREERLRRMGCGGVVPADNETRVTVMFEPILYFENTVEYRSCAVVHTPRIDPHDIDQALAKGHSNSSCSKKSAIALRSSYFFDLYCRNPSSHDTAAQLDHFNKRILFHRYGVWVTHTFAHYPRILDRLLCAEHFDDQTNGLADLMMHLRRKKHRTGAHVNVMYIYPYIALAQQRAIDEKMAVAAASRNWCYPSRASDLDFEYLPNDGMGPFMRATRALPNFAPCEDGQKGCPDGFERKWDYYVYPFEESSSLYSFFMLRGVDDVEAAKRLLQRPGRSKLFVTVNDNFPAYIRPLDVDVEGLLKIVAGDSGQAPWEMT